VHTPATSRVVVRRPGSTETESAAVAPRALPVIDVFVQTVSLTTLNYFGSGQDTLESGHTVYGEKQTLTGASVTYPLGTRALRPLQAALLAGATGRFIDIRPGSSQAVPSIEQVYDESTAPGLHQQPTFIEFREGLRLTPSVAGGRLYLNYLFSAQQFTTTRDTQSAFRRWGVDLQHEIPLYRAARSSGPREFNGPNECAQAVGSSGCPPVQWSRNREGSIGLRLLLNASTTTGANQVPFYLQPTLGGSDINNESLLSSYRDYRFRAPNLLALQEHVEHVLWGPIGAFFLAEQGKVTSTPGELDFSHLATSMRVGVTLRAGGFPMVNLSFSWGSEGHHVIGSMNSTLLGGSPRPSLW
jgi:hypothetical protein